MLKERIRILGRATSDGPCLRCGAAGQDPIAEGDGFDRPMTLCSGCLSTVLRICREARSKDHTCPECFAEPEISITFDKGKLRVRVFCRKHRNITARVWREQDANPLAVFGTEAGGCLYLSLAQGGFARSSYSLDSGDANFTPARFIGEDREKTIELEDGDDG